MKGWETKTLADVCEVFADGDWVESKDQSQEGIRLIQTGNVGQGVFKDRGDKARYISEATFNRLRCTEIFEGDCLISRLPDPVGRSCILPDTDERMITAVDCTIVRFNPRLVLAPFFNFYSQSLDYLKAVDSATTGTTRNRISRSNLGLIPIPVPPLPEQRRIVAILDEAFEGIATAKANAEKNLQSARALFESHLQSVFSQHGEGWVEKALGELATFRNGINFTKSSRGETVKIVGVKDFQQSFWAPLDGLATVTPEGVLPESDLLKENDLLFVRSNGNMQLIGRCLLIGKVTDKITHSGFTIRARLNGGGVSARYLCHFLKSSLARRKMIDSGIGTNIKSLNQTTLSALAIPVPSIAEQETIVDQLESVDAETQRLASIYARKLGVLEALKKSLLDQAFTGRL